MEMHHLTWATAVHKLIRIYIEDITEWREDMDIMFERQKQYLRSKLSKQRRYCPCHILILLGKVWQLPLRQQFPQICKLSMKSRYFQNFYAVL